MFDVTRQRNSVLVSVVLLSMSCCAGGRVDLDKSGTVDDAHESAMLQNPFIDESEDVPGTLTGFPDPFPFKWGDDYYLCHSVVDLRNGRMYRTKTFAPGDLKKFPIVFDFGDVEGVWQVWGFKPYRHTDGSYHAYGSVHYGNYITETVHFVPQAGQTWTKEHPIQKWKLESILVSKEEAHSPYEGNVIRDDDGALYLVINEQWKPNRNCVTLRRMLDPDTVDPDFTTRLLLEPEAYQSEAMTAVPLRATESTIIQRIQGKWALFYSVGWFDHNTYKVGVAYSDTLVPPEGEEYQKVLVPDPENVWGNGPEMGGMEVKYVVQSQKSNWHNYAGHLVNGPGIGSMVEVAGGGPHIMFAARRRGVEHTNGCDKYCWRMPAVVDMSGPTHTWIEMIYPSSPAEGVEMQSAFWPES